MASSVHARRSGQRFPEWVSITLNASSPQSFPLGDMHWLIQCQVLAETLLPIKHHSGVVCPAAGEGKVVAGTLHPFLAEFPGPCHQLTGCCP